MPQPRTANRILEEEFLTLRATALELAAGLDRLDQADGDIASDTRRKRLTQAINVLLEPEPDRAERVQLLFSREYSADWPTKLDVRLEGRR